MKKKVLVKPATLSKAKKAKTKKELKLDGGIGPIETQLIRQAMRLVWQRASKARAIVKERCLVDKECSKCEECGEVVGKIYVDHIVAVGDLDEGYLKRLWCSSKEMQGICKKCHDEKTKEERKISRLKAKEKNETESSGRSRVSSEDSSFGVEPKSTRKRLSRSKKFSSATGKEGKGESIKDESDGKRSNSMVKLTLLETAEAMEKDKLPKIIEQRSSFNELLSEIPFKEVETLSVHDFI